MDGNAQIKIEKQDDSDVLLERDIFLYKIPLDAIHKNPGQCHKAKDWDISNPVGGYKLILLADDSDSCHIQLKDGKGDFFGYGIIDCYPGPAGSTSSSSITPVADSSRYFTTKIRKLSSGQDELIGIGFINRNDSSSLINTLEGYFTSGNGSAVQIYKPVNSKESLASAVPSKVPSKLFERRTFQYDCQLCPIHFEKPELLKQHIESSHIKQSRAILFYCDVTDCSKRFLSQLTLDNHKIMEHQEDPKNMLKRVKRIRKNNRRRRREAENRDISTTLTSPTTTLPTNEQLQKNNSAKTPALSVHDEVQDLDEECITAIDNLLNDPNGSVFQDELKTLFWCPFCPSQAFTATNEKDLFKHLRDRSIHRTGKTRICEICSLMFRNVERYRYHANIFHFTCLTCVVPFKREDRLRNHVLKVHKQSLKYRCDHCPSHFTVHELLIEHYKTEHPLPATDPIGKQSGIDPIPHHPPVSQLTVGNSKRMEHPENPYPIKRLKCADGHDRDERKGAWNNIGTLVDNPNGAVYHDEFKATFWCPICPLLAFTTGNEKVLIKHLKNRLIHGTGKPKICGICSLVFNNEERFLYHAHIFHFTCSVCMISFKDDEDKLRRHVLKCHKQTLTYQCHRCPSNFSFHELFVEHLKTEHPHPSADPRGSQSDI